VGTYAAHGLLAGQARRLPGGVRACWGSGPTTTSCRSTSRPTAPQAALREAAEILIKSLAIFTDQERLEVLHAGHGGRIEGEAAAAAAGPADVQRSDPMDDILSEELDLGVRSSVAAEPA
jgi:hypothetical protein